MSTLFVCPVCKAPLAHDSPGAVCPQCAANGKVKSNGSAVTRTSETDESATSSFSLAQQAQADGMHGANPRDAEAPEVVANVGIPGYEFLREINRGGQGVVYQALQISTKRKVAVKVLLDGRFASRVDRKRFEREIELVASLKHPNIIAVFDSGVTPDGHPYYVMDYIRGLPITRYLREQQVALPEALRLFAVVCSAVNHAHQKGIIHRDLKPSNILVDSEGACRVLDFGLAKTLSAPEESVFSLTGQVVGTLPYMSPEQTGGNPDLIDTRTDVYSLGVVLYELLSGAHPYPTTGTLVEMVRHITMSEPASVIRAWQPEAGIRSPSVKASRCPLDHELETIVHKSLAKARERRYQSAGELARDINNYLSGSPLDARRDSALYLLSKTLRRNRLPVAVGAAFTLLALGSIIALSILYSRQGQLLVEVQEKEQVAQAQKGAAQAAEVVAHSAAVKEAEQRHAAEEQLHLSRLAFVRASVEVKDFPTARKVLIESAVPNELADDWHWTAWSFFHASREVAMKDITPWFPAEDRAHLLRRQGRGAPFPMYLDPERNRIVVSPETNILPTGDVQHKAAESTNGVFTIDLTTGKNAPLEISQAHPLVLPGISVVNRLNLAMVRSGPLQLPDGKSVTLFYQSDGGGVVMTEGVKEVCRLLFSHQPSACAISHDGKMVAVGFETGRIDGFILETSLTGAPVLNQLFSIQGYRESIASLAFSVDDRKIHAISDGMIYRSWIWSPTPDLAVLPANSKTVRHIAFSPDGTLVATGGYDGHVKIFDVKTKQLRHDINAHAVESANFGMLQFLPDGKHLLTSGSDAMVRIWDLEASNFANDVDYANSPVTKVLTQLLDLTRQDVKLSQLDRSLSEIALGNTPRGELTPDGKTLYLTNGFQWTATTEGQPNLQQWDISDLAHPRKVGEFKSTPGIYMPYNIRLLPRDHRLFAVNSTVSGGGDEHKACQIYDTSTTPPTPGPILDDGEADHRDLDISSDGSLLALSTWQGTCSLWDWRNQRRLAMLEVNPGHSTASVVSSVRFHPTLQLVATACHDSRVNLFSTATFRKLATIDIDPQRKLAFGAHGPLKEAVFSPDGSIMAIGAGDDLWLVNLSFYDQEIQALLRDRNQMATSAPAPAARHE